MQSGTLKRERIGHDRVTINDLAARLGVTKSTVSRALNGYDDIAPATRLRVERIAKEMNYRPLAPAQAIKTGRARSLGLVLQSNTHDAHRPFLSEFLAGVTSAASGEGWTLTVATADSDQDTLKTYERLVEERKADGFILPRTLSDDPRIDFLRAREVPFVLYGRTRNDSNCAWFDILGEQAMQDATTRFAAAGHRRIAHLSGQSGYHYSVLREAGYRSGLRAAGLDIVPELIVSNVANRERGAVATKRLLDLPEPPTAIVAAVDLGALGAYDAAAERGLRMGRDLSIIAYDGIPEGAFANPPLTTYAVDSHYAGQRLAALLIQRIRGVPPGMLRETAVAALVERGSDGSKTTMGGNR